MICEFQNQHELDYADRRKAMDEKNATTALDNTVDDIQEARDDNGGDDARAFKGHKSEGGKEEILSHCNTT